MIQRFISTLLLIFCMYSLCGCPIIAGTLDSVRRVGLTASSRESLLGPAVTKFHEALGWGNLTAALAYVKDENRNEFRDQFLKDKDKVKVIESAIDLTEFQNDSYQATIFITVKAYTVPFYVIEAKKQVQIWEFSLTKGWKLVSRSYA